MIPYKDIKEIEDVESSRSNEMQNALDLWYNLYLDQAPWLKKDQVYSLNIAAFICSELARQILLEVKWDITGVKQKSSDEPVMNPRAQYLKAELQNLFKQLRQKLEQGLAAGGLVIRPYPHNGHIWFDFTMAWSLYPIAFDDSGMLTDVIFRDIYDEGKYRYTRLERHTQQDDGSVIITQRAFKSADKNSIGKEVSLQEVAGWQDLQPEAKVTDVNGNLFGIFKTACANNIDVDSPIGVSAFARAVNTIEQADKQYSRFIWEYESTETAIDVDPLALRQDSDGNTVTPKLNERLFRAVNLGSDGTYNIFSPTIRDASQINGMNQLFLRIEDQTGLSRGTLSDANIEARTATELKINKQRSYDTISDNQAALEDCLREVIHAMDVYATLYNLAPQGDYEVSFEWDDSVITDMEAQTQEKLMLVNSGIMSKAEFRQWYFGETKAQAETAIQNMNTESTSGIDAIINSMGEGIPPQPE